MDKVVFLCVLGLGAHIWGICHRSLDLPRRRHCPSFVNECTGCPRTLWFLGQRKYNRLKFPKLVSYLSKLPFFLFFTNLLILKRGWYIIKLHKHIFWEKTNLVILCTLLIRFSLTGVHHKFWYHKYPRCSKRAA